jgi:hypothetical protein
MKFPKLNNLNGDQIEIPLNDDQFKQIVSEANGTAKKPPIPKYEQHKYEQKMIQELYKDTQFY